jgi:type II secretory pathway pseudopilin PulG
VYIIINNKIIRRKTQMNNALKQAKGMTLITVIVTIIILLILAGVSIAIFLNNDGIINKTEQAKQKAKEAEEEENNMLGQVGSLIDNYTMSTTDTPGTVTGFNLDYDNLDYLYNIKI